MLQEQPTGTLVRVPLDDPERGAVAEGIGDLWRVHDGTIVTSTGRVTDESGEYHGDLVVVDPEAGTRRVLDTNAVYIEGFPPEVLPAPAFADDVLYYVSDGDRSGLWRSALP